MEPLTWYRIGDPMTHQAQCALSSCILWARITDGSRALCNQHATPHALAGTVQKSRHMTAEHQHGIPCVFCGQDTWYAAEGQPMMVCRTCHAPQRIESGKKGLLDIMTFPSSSSTVDLPKSRPAPMSAHERARQDKWTSNFLAWRDRSPRMK